MSNDPFVEKGTAGSKTEVAEPKKDGPLSEEEQKKQKLEARKRRQEERDQKELARWQKEKARPKHAGYLWYLMLVLTLVYIVDEVATNLNSTMQPYMIEEFFENGLGLNANDAQAKWDGYGALGLLMQVITIFYRPLADRFGRKIFLVFNTLILAIGMILCYSSPFFPVYLVGYLMLVFMTGPDMQVVYVTECSPKEHRAAFVSVIKGIAQLGIALIAIGMQAFMKGNDSAWRKVFLIPAILGFVVAFLALLFTRETDQFLDQRIAYLSMSPEQKEALMSNKVSKNAETQGGAIATAKFGFRHHQLRWLFIASMLYTTAFYATGYYGQTITDAGYNATQLGQVAIVWPFVCSAITIVYGLLSDKLGRKVVSTALGSLAVVGLALLCTGLYCHWNEYVNGVFLGFFLAGYWNWGDTIILMVSESCPTNFRSSAAGDQGLFAAVGYLIGYAVTILYTKFATGALQYLDFVYLGVAIPGVLGAILVIVFKVHETKGIDLDTVKGDEWDEKPVKTSEMN
jgi:MFS family permease